MRNTSTGSHVIDTSVARSWSFEEYAPAAGPFSTLSVDFDGVDDDARTGNGAVAGATTFSLSCWVKSSTAVASGLIARSGGGRYNYILRLTAGGQAELAFETAASGIQTLTGTLTTLQDGAWHHVAATFDGGTLAAALYVDGYTDATAAFAAVPNDTGARRVYLGRYSTEYLPGRLDECAIYSTALSAGDVLAIYNAGAPMSLADLASSPGLVAWWRMGDGAGDAFPTIADAKGAASLTMTNMIAADIVEDAP